MSWHKDQGRSERGYHHGNLKEALLQAALKLDCRKRCGRLHLCRCRAHGPASAPPRPIGISAIATNLLASVAQRGFVQFEAAAECGLGRRPPRYGRPRSTGWERPIWRSRATSPRSIRRCSNRACRWRPIPTLQAAGERAFAIIRAACRTPCGDGAARRCRALRR